MSLQLDDPAAGGGTLWGNGTLELYPSREWQPDEMLLSRLPVGTDATAIPQAYRLTLGRRPTGAELALARLFLRESPLSELCRALFNVNEFVYLD